MKARTVVLTLVALLQAVTAQAQTKIDASRDGVDRESLMMTPDMTSPTPAPVAQHSFACASCGQAAGVLHLFGPASAGEVTRDSFSSRSTYKVAPESFERLRTIIVTGDAHTLYEFDLEIASFYCPGCRACYCGEHWARWNVFDDEDGFDWHDSIRGRCPMGHQRMLED